MRRELEGNKGLTYLLDRGAPLQGENTEEAQNRLRELAQEFLRIRNRSGERVKLVPNEAQKKFERMREQRNIVLKARQMGISTWVSGRFFLKTITKTGTLTVQVAHTVDASVSFRFKTWSKLSMALSAGSQHMNLLAPASDAAANGSGSKGLTATNLAASGSTATFLAMASTAGFTAGCIVAVDEDYAGQAGFVGSGVYASYVQSAAAVNSDPDYVRRVTFNVARVSQVTSSGLQLTQPLIAGVPAATMRVQPVLGFVDREGGNFFQEWSGLFVMAGEQGERILFYYPRLQAVTGATEAAAVLDAPIERIALAANFRALPVTDANDGQQAVCFRSFLPSAMTLV